MLKKKLGGLLALSMALLIVAAPAWTTPPLVNVTIEPTQIAVGESAQITITSSGSAMDALKLPDVPGLEFRVVGQTRRVEIINGATLATSSVLVRVTAQTAGVFTIPGITPQSQPLVLRVRPDTGVPSVSGRNFSGKPLPGASGNGLHMTPDGSAFVRLVLPKREAYVGESVPVEIEVGMRAGFVTSLNGLPTLTGNDFTLNNLSHQPERVEKLIDGKPFSVLTWRSVIAAVKPGKFSLSVESPLTVRIRTRPARESMLDDLLGDPFMQNFFGTTVPKDITVASPPSELTVLELPREGRPSDFSGAVGSFKIASDVTPAEAAAGDPMTLRLHVTGSGNFDRVDTPMLERSPRWKTYPPKATFSPSDALGYKGDKVFEQPLIAADPGRQVLPPLSFSYFDPSARRYETARSAPLTVTIAPSLADSSQPPPPQTGAGAGRPPSSPKGAPPGNGSPASDELRPDHPVTAGAASSLLPLYLQPAFLALPSLLALGFAGGWLRRRHAAPQDVEPRGRRSRLLSASTARAIKDLETAADAGDAPLFFKLARSTLLRFWAAQWHVAPAHLSRDELDQRLGEHAADIHRLFALADETNYSGDAPATDFEPWLKIVRAHVSEARAA